MKKYLLEIAVFVCGAAVMVFELIGSRLVAPFAGTSIYTWTSLIGVILASLSAGYYAGGIISDKKQSKFVFGGIIAVSALFICFTAVAKDLGFALMRLPFGTEWNTVLISLILFAPAGFFLGMVSPYAARLKIHNLENVGRGVGNLYAFSTAGSIFGTFLAGFFIIPNAGSVFSLFLTAGVLLVLALLIMGAVKDKGTAYFYAIIFFVFILSLASVFFEVKNPDLLAEIDTQYNKILIYKSADRSARKDIIVYSTDPFGAQAAVFADGSDELVFNYTKFFRMASRFNGNLKNTLMIGGCVNTYPRDFIKNYPDSRMDIVEIDPFSTEIARKYFFFQDSPQFSFFYEDGRVFLNENQKKYDAIFVDAFNSASSIPFHLTTKEAVKKQYDALTDSGIVMTNTISSLTGAKGKFLRAEYATYKSVFPQVFVFLVSNPERPELTQNIMIAAWKSEQEINIDSENLWREEIPQDAPVLTDDFAPVEFYKRESI